MTAEELLAEVESLGVVVTLDHRDLVLRPKSRLTPQLVERLRTHKPELLDLLELRTWPEASRDAVRRFGQSCARLYPFIGREVETPQGRGRLLQVLQERATVVLDVEPDRAKFFIPSEVRPPGVAVASSPTEPEVH